MLNFFGKGKKAKGKAKGETRRIGTPDVREQHRYQQLLKAYQGIKTELEVCKNRIQQQNININYMKSNYEQAQKEKTKALQKAERYYELIQRMCHSLAASELARERIANADVVDSWTPEEFCDFVIQAVRTRERELYQKWKKAETDAKAKEDLIERLKEELNLIQQSRMNASFSVMSESEPANTSNNQRQHPHSSDSHYTDPKKIAESNKESIKHDSGSNGKRSHLVVENLSDVTDRLTIEHKVLVEIIGRHGIFRTIELKEHPRFLETFNVNSNYYMQKLQDLSRMGFLDTSSVRTGTRGHVYEVFVLTEKGKQLYETLYGTSPVESQLNVLLRRHASPEHAIFVLDTKLAFEKDGWEVDDTLDGNRVALDDGRVAIFDLTIKKGGEVRRIECERGIQSESDIKEKLNKWSEISKRFFFVSPNKSSLDKVKTKFFSWVAEQGGRKEMISRGISAYFITLEDLKKGNEWEEVRFK